MSASQRPPARSGFASATRTTTDTAPTSELDPLRALRDYGEAVAMAGAALGLTQERLARAEGMDRLELALSVPLDEARAWDGRRLAEAFALLGDDLRVDLALSGLEMTDAAPSATLSANAAPGQALAVFLDQARDMAASHGEDATVELRLTVGKTGAHAVVSRLLAMRQEYLGTAEALAQTKLVVWYHAAAFGRLARLSGLAEWERLGLVRASGRTVVVVCDAGGYLAGPALEVIGAQRPAEPRWLLLSRPAWRQFQERCDAARRLRDEESPWIGGPRLITPGHLRLAPRDPGLEELASALGELRAGVSAAYLAGAVQQTEDDLLLRFAGTRPATCRLVGNESRTSPPVPLSREETGNLERSGSAVSTEPTPPARFSTGEGGESERSDDPALGRFAAWAFEHGTLDKLLIARECLARELPAGAEVSLAQVEAAAGPAFEAARANFALYLRGRSHDYFQAREQAATAVEAYTLGVRKEVSDLTGDVVSNVFATVGLLVGVVIAGLIQPRASLPVQRLGTALYTVYVAFILWFLLRARRERFQLERAEVTRRLEGMSELSETERVRLREQAGAADAHFDRYFALAWRIYVILACLGALYFLLLLTPLAPHVALPHGR